MRFLFVYVMNVFVAKRVYSHHYNLIVPTTKKICFKLQDTKQLGSLAGLLLRYTVPNQHTVDKYDNHI